MVSGILGLVLLILWPISWIGSVVALVLGFTSRRQIRERSEGGDGYSIAGIALGFVGGAVWVVAVGIIALVFLLGTFVKSAFVQTCDAFPPEGTAAASC
jgi:Flp pilus assembly pilin Flp